MLLKVQGLLGEQLQIVMLQKNLKGPGLNLALIRNVLTYVLQQFGMA